MDNKSDKKEVSSVVLDTMKRFTTLVKGPMTEVLRQANKLGEEAYRLRVKGEANSICFALSKSLSMARKDNGEIRDSFKDGWDTQAKDMAGVYPAPDPDKIDLPSCLLGYSKLPEDAYILLAQKM